MKVLNLLFKLGLTAAICSLSACSIPSEYLNPFHPETSESATLGVRNDSYLDSGAESGKKARVAMEAIGGYQEAHDPQPYNPVIKPAIVRLMWVPDHLNQHGDLVPAHYYYLKVKGDQWAVSDAFELESQLNGEGGGGSRFGNLPFTYGK